MQAMLDAGIATRRGIMCAHREEPLHRRAPHGSLPHSEAAQDRRIVLPLYPQMTDGRRAELVAATLQGSAGADSERCRQADTALRSAADHDHPARPRLVRSRSRRRLALPRAAVRADQARHPGALQAGRARRRPGPSSSRCSPSLIFTIVFGIFAQHAVRRHALPGLRVRRRAAVDLFRRSACAAPPPASSTDAELVRKVYFPRLIMPLANVISPLLDFCIAFVVLLVLMLVLRHRADAGRSCCIPPLVLIAALLALADRPVARPDQCPLPRHQAHAAVHAAGLDVRLARSSIRSAWCRAKWQALYSLNPMVGVIEGFRWARVRHAAARTSSPLGISLAHHRRAARRRPRLLHAAWNARSRT